jgi:hypothetical protein
MPEPGIFISYRREDSAGDAGRLADHLHQRFGAARVFLDIDTIEPGTDFVDVLQASVQQTAVMLVVIGPRWATLRGADGTPRLEDPKDFVRHEVEAALGRGIPVVPVLVQGAALPRAADVPASLTPLMTRQAAVLDHADFHDDVERLCDRLAPVLERGTFMRWARVRRRWLAASAAILLVIAVAGYFATPARDAGRQETSTAPAGRDPTPPVAVDPRIPERPSTTTTATTTTTALILPSARRPATQPAARSTAAATETRPSAPAAEPKAGDLANAARVDALLAETSMQRRRHQTVEALETLARARELAPDSETVRRTQAEVAMEWIRHVRVEAGRTSFSEAIKPALAVVDAALPAATGADRADLLAHSGWATFLAWRDGNRSLDPVEWYQEALSLDAGNPYANAMLAHWVLYRDNDVPRAAALFETALRSKRATGAVRMLQWGGYRNVHKPEADAERIRLADAMRREGQRLSMEQASALWGPYYFAVPSSSEKDRQVLLGALPPDDHISTLDWAFDEYAGQDEFRRRLLRYYTALLHAGAGRVSQAVDELRKLDRETAEAPGSLRDAVQAALRRLQSS